MVSTPTESGLPLHNGKFEGLADALNYAAGGRGGYNFYDGTGRLESVLPYGELRAGALSLARRLTSLGLPRYSRVAIIADTAPFFHRFFFAAQYAGFIPVPLPAAIQMGGGDAYVAQIRKMMQSCGAAVAVAPDGYLKLLHRAVKPLSLVLAGSPADFDALPEVDDLPKPLAGDEPAYLQYTSGSTRFPRGVEMSQRAVLSNLPAISLAYSEGFPLDEQVGLLVQASLNDAGMDVTLDKQPESVFAPARFTQGNPFAVDGQPWPLRTIDMTNRVVKALGAQLL